MPRSNWIAVATLFATSSFGIASAQSINNLGVLAGASDSFAVGLSADGRVATGVSGGRAFRWSSETGMQALSLLAPLGIGETAGGYAVSGDGSVIVGYSGSRPVRWSASGGVEDLGSTGSPGGSGALDVNADGTKIVGYSGTSSFIWTATSGMQMIAGQSQARAITGDGTTVAGHLYTSSSAFRWQGSGAVEAIISGAGAEDLSADGAIVVGWVQTEVGQQAFRWSATSALQIVSPSGANSAYAEAVSGDGSIVVGGSQSAVGNRAFLWTSATGSIDLFDHLSHLGVDMAGWSQLTSATNISANGRIVLGYGVHNGENRAFIADIGVIPAPGALGLLAFSGMCIRRRR